MFEGLETKEWLSLNAKLQTKKNALRKALAKKGMLKKDGKNNYDNYSYFSEAQYKKLFTELLSENKLELKFEEVSYDQYVGSGKMPNGRLVQLQFMLIDCDTGFYEETLITGEALDKGDKAGYKAYTGALKYYLANTFMVATGDDPEQDSPDNQPKKQTKPQQKKPPEKITSEQFELLDRMDASLKEWLLTKFKVGSLEELTSDQAQWFINAKRNKEKEGKGYYAKKLDD